MLADLQREFRTWLTTGTDEVAERFGAGATAGLAARAETASVIPAGPATTVDAAGY